MSKRSALPCCPPLSELLQPRLFKALSDPNRLALLMRLCSAGASCTVSQMSACCPVDLSVVSRHLSMLRDAGVLEAKRHGKEVHYRVRIEPVVRWLRDLARALEICCGKSAATAGDEPPPYRARSHRTRSSVRKKEKKQ